jgi:hypothetical protein
MNAVRSCRPLSATLPSAAPIDGLSLHEQIPCDAGCQVQSGGCGKESAVAPSGCSKGASDHVGSHAHQRRNAVAQAKQLSRVIRGNVLQWPMFFGKVSSLHPWL